MSVYSPLKIGYVHIPKTAGTSMAKWIGLNTSGSVRLLKHESASMLLDEHPKIDYFFTIVRNPWSRVVSFYRDVTNKNFEKAITEVDLKSYDYPNGVNGVEQLKEYANKLTFEDFINHHIDTKTNRWYNMTTNQIKWLDCPMDLIVKMENIDKEFEKIQKLFRNNAPLLHLNNHIHPDKRDYTLFYNEHTKKRIAEIYGEDIEVFKYKFEE